MKRYETRMLRGDAKRGGVDEDELAEHGREGYAVVSAAWAVDEKGRPVVVGALVQRELRAASGSLVEDD